MKEVAYQKNMLLSSLLNELLDQHIGRFQGENTVKAQLAFLLLTRNEKKEEFEEIHDCINTIKRNIASGNYRMALRILALTQMKIDRFQT